jgi:hypothetical protein
MKDRYTRVTAPAGIDGQATRRDQTRNAAQEFRLRIKRWKAEQKYPAKILSFDDSDKRGLAYLRAHHLHRTDALGPFGLVRCGPLIVL